MTRFEQANFELELQLGSLAENRLIRLSSDIVYPTNNIVYPTSNTIHQLKQA